MSDRRAQRRQDTIDEIVDSALRQIAAEGAAGLSLGAVAREIGIKTPSLYVYFDSKAALYDEIFRRGWVELGQITVGLAAGSDVRAALAESMRVFVEWAAQHPAHAQLLFWRPVPAWEPSPAAFKPAIAALDAFNERLVLAQQDGDLRADVSVDELAQVWSALVAGVISQQLSNEPGVALEDGRVSRFVDSFVDMFLLQYAPRRTP
jgi:AcrR family transcriptional regulator